MIALDHQDQVAIVKLNRGVTNALNLELVNELAETLQQVKSDASVQGLVLGTANDKFFAIGFDIPQLFGLGRAEFARFYRAFNRLCLDLYTLPKPTIGALTGHGIAGGCILALCCDYRFIAAGRRLLGLNEIKLGVPVPYPADCILRALVGVRHARDIIESGAFYAPEQSLQMGLVDAVWPLEQVLSRSIEKVKLLGASPHPAFAQIKRNRVETTVAQIRARLEEKEQFFLDCWYAAETRARLREAMEKF